MKNKVENNEKKNYKKWNNLLKEYGYLTIDEFKQRIVESDKLNDEQKEGKLFDWDYSYSEKEIKKYIKEKGKSLNMINRNWVFTMYKPWRNYEHPNDLIKKVEKDPEVKLCVYSYEVGENYNSPHFQGFIQFKNKKSKKQLIKYFNDITIYLEPQYSSDFDNNNYISKIEGMDNAKLDIKTSMLFKNINNKIYYSKGNKKTLMNKMMNYGEYVDYCLSKHISPKKTDISNLVINADDNPKKALERIKEIYNFKYNNLMKLSDIKPLRPIILTGKSGSGKSIITTWMFDELGYSYGDIFKQEANKKQQKLWFTKDTVYNQVCYFTELTTYFPNKTDLLSLIDKQSRLEVKGQDSIPNNFKLLVLNSTHSTLNYIYNLVHNYPTYYEIMRRINKGNLYFVFENPKYTDLSYNDKNEMTLEKLLNEYTPEIYKFININGSIEYNEKISEYSDILIKGADSERNSNKFILINNPLELYDAMKYKSVDMFKSVLVKYFDDIVLPHTQNKKIKEMNNNELENFIHKIFSNDHFPIKEEFWKLYDMLPSLFINDLQLVLEYINIDGYQISVSPYPVSKITKEQLADEAKKLLL